MKEERYFVALHDNALIIILGPFETEEKAKYCIDSNFNEKVVDEETAKKIDSLGYNALMRRHYNLID